jgi:hypothetical protein
MKHNVSRVPAHLLALGCLLTVSAEAQLGRFQGPWGSPPADSGPSSFVTIRNLQVRIEEPCPLDPMRACRYEAEATAYGPTATPTPEETSALVLQYRIEGAVRVSVLSFHEDALLVERFTRTLGEGKRRTTIDSVLFRRAATANGGEAPQFPWPPPTPTSFQTLPAGLVTAGEGDSLGRVFDRLKLALSRIEGGFWSVYAIGSDGFAIVTKIEAIEPDGRPKPLPDRWQTPSDRLPRRITGIGDYLRALFTAKPGRYRFLVLAVTGKPISGSETALTSTEAMRLLRSGTDDLPASLRAVTLGPSGRCVALIYEFERASEVSEARFLEASPVSVATHLIRAGLWEAGQLTP